MYVMYDIMEILRQVIQLLILMGCGVGVVFLIMVLKDLQKFLNRAADLGIQSMEKLCSEIDHLDDMIDVVSESDKE
ncbi:MAG: hypothetical protein IJ486_02430 [Firmicutes bacterium]|nr:hypothetical protein [Bacillota bacterium]